MDPITIGTTALGLGLGGAQLSIQVLESVVKGFAYFESAANADQECQAFRLKLRFEYARLRQWGHQSGLVDESSRLYYEQRMGQQRFLVLAILNELKSKLREMRQSELRYDSIASSLQHTNLAELDGSISSGLPCEPLGDLSDVKEASASGTRKIERSTVGFHDLPEEEWSTYDQIFISSDNPRTARRHKKGLNHIVFWAQGAAKIAEEPKRLMWAIKDKAKFSDNLGFVTSLVDRLVETLSQDQMAQVLRDTQEIRLVMAMMNNSLEEMRALQQASQALATPLGSLSGQTLVQSESELSNYRTGCEYARMSEKHFKDFYQQAIDFAIEAKGSITFGNPWLPACDVKSLTLTIGIEDGLRQAGHIDGASVWVEWRAYTSRPFYLGNGRMENRPQAEIEARAGRLGALLKTDKKPAQFCIPPFMGVFDDKIGERFGFVFKSAADLAGENVGTSLLYRLQGRPALLHERVAIAQQLTQWLLYLHTVDWLHKGIRSSSVLFFRDNTPDGFGRAYITGFEYSRFVGGDTETSGPPDDLMGSMYVHPEYLGGSNYRFRKTYDIYAMGIVLIELAYWKPIDQILGVGSTAQAADNGSTSAPFKRSLKVRSSILEQEGGILHHVEQVMGKRYASATKACVEGMSAFGLAEDKDQEEPLISGLLQQAFIQVVVSPLQSIVV